MNITWLFRKKIWRQIPNCRFHTSISILCRLLLDPSQNRIQKMHQTLINTITMTLFWIVWYYSYILRKFAHNERVLPSSRWQRSKRMHHVTGFVYIPRKSAKLIWNGKNFLHCVFAEVLTHGKISAAKQKILDAKRMPQNACRTKTLYMKPPLRFVKLFGARFRGTCKYLNLVVLNTLAKVPKCSGWFSCTHRASCHFSEMCRIFVFRKTFWVLPNTDTFTKREWTNLRPVWLEVPFCNRGQLLF